MTNVIAWHEAGHVVIARALNIPIEFVSIEEGRPRTRYARERTPEEGVWTTLAAAVAVLEFTGRQDLADYGAAGDFDTLEDFLHRFSSVEARDLAMERATEGLPKLVRTNKAAINKVAEQLLREGRLSEKAVDQHVKDSASAWSRLLGCLCFWRER